MAQDLERDQWGLVDPTEFADVYVINSCTVTAEADRQTRQAVRRALPEPKSPCHRDRLLCSEPGRCLRRDSGRFPGIGQRSQVCRGKVCPELEKISPSL